MAGWVKRGGKGAEMSLLIVGPLHKECTTRRALATTGVSGCISPRMPSACVHRRPPKTRTSVTKHIRQEQPYRQLTRSRTTSATQLQTAWLHQCAASLLSVAEA